MLRRYVFKHPVAKARVTVGLLLRYFLIDRIFGLHLLGCPSHPYHERPISKCTHFHSILKFHFRTPHTPMSNRFGRFSSGRPAFHRGTFRRSARNVTDSCLRSSLSRIICIVTLRTGLDTLARRVLDDCEGAARCWPYSLSAKGFYGSSSRAWMFTRCPFR